MITSYVTLTDAPWKEVLQFAITLFAILNPVAGATIYLALVEKHPRHEKIWVAHKTTMAITVILLSIIWMGDAVLNIFGISLAAFRIGGGFIVIFIGLSMLEFIELGFKPDVSEEQKKDVAIVPLAIPIIAGPGVIAVTLTEMQNTFDTMREKIIVTLTTFVVIFMMWIILRFAPFFARKLGKTGVDIMGKIMGMILVVIATQMILEGVMAIYPSTR